MVIVKETRMCGKHGAPAMVIVPCPPITQNAERSQRVHVKATRPMVGTGRCM